MRRVLNIPPATASVLALFHRDESPEMEREAVRYDIQADNSVYIWKAIINRPDFQAAEYRLKDGATRILSKSAREGIDWQLSYIASDGIPTMHGDYLLPEHYDSRHGHSMEKLYQELSKDNIRHRISVTLLMEEGRKEMESEMNERDFSFIADTAKLYSVYNNVPVSPDSEYIKAYEQKYGKLEREDYDRLITETMLEADTPPKVAILQPKDRELSFRTWEELEQAGETENVTANRYEVVHISNEMAGMSCEDIYIKLNSDEPRPANYYGYSLSQGDIIILSVDVGDKAYFVNDIGFVELPAEFINHELQAKLMYGLDVRQERDLLERSIEYSGNIDFDMTEQTERLSAIDGEYGGVFDLADVSLIMEREKYRIREIAKSDTERQGISHFIFLNGDYMLSPEYLQELRASTRTVPEQLQRDINDRFFDEMTEQDKKQLVYDYEVVFGVPENDRMTKWYSEMSVPVQKPWYKENDPSTMGRAENEQGILISTAMIEQRAREIYDSVGYVSLQQQKEYFLKFSRENISGIIGGMVAELQSKAADDIKRQGSPWGAWFATIADPKKPEDYIEIDITGYSMRDSVVETATLVMGNTVTATITMPELNTDVYLNRESLGTEEDQFITRIKREFVERLTPEMQGYELYNPFGFDKGLALDEHRELLRKEGLPDMPDGRVFDTRATEKHEETERLPHGEEDRTEYIYYTTQRPVAPLTHPPRGLITFENYDSRTYIETIGGEAWGRLVYDRPLDEKEIQEYELVREPKRIVPVREFQGADGKTLAGFQIGMELSEGKRVDRRYVYDAVNEFQRENDLPSYMKVIDEDGNCEDRDILYDAYDVFVGMSHERDEDMQLYREDMEILAFNYVERSKTDMYQPHEDYVKYKFMSEVYYALKNGLSPEQIDYMIVSSAEAAYPEENMRNIRAGFENGLTETQLDIVNGEEFYTQQYIIEYMVNGGDNERARALKGADMATANYLIEQYKESSLEPDKASAIVEAMNRIREAGSSGRFRSSDYDFFAEYFCNTASAQEPGTIKNIGEKFAAQSEQNDISLFIAEKGGLDAFRPGVTHAHGEDVKNAAEQQRFGLQQEEEKKSAKEILSDQLHQGIKNVMNSEDYKRWLDTSSRLYYNNYSVNNAILVYMQKPDASYTMGYDAWKDYGRNVAPGAKGAKIFVPVMAYEKSQGSLYRMITNSLREQLKESPGNVAVFKVGMSKLEFTMNQSGQMGYRVNGSERGIFENRQQVQRFIQGSILGKVPMYFNIGNVFDVKDTVIPEYLWVKRGYTKSELVLDDKGKPIQNKKGEYKIVNTPERIAKFKPSLVMDVAEQNPEKMNTLFESLKSVSERNGIPVYIKERDDDETLKGGAEGYFSRKFDEKNPKGHLVIASDLDPTKKCSVMFHEMAHSDLHGNLAKLAQEMKEKNVSRNMREVQAESVAYATAKRFGIETDTSSFQYLAAYSNGFELQDLQKSMDVIYKECKKLTQEITAELDARGLNLDLTEKLEEPMQRDTVDTLSKQFVAYALEQENHLVSIKQELPNLVGDNKANLERLSVIKEQKYCVDRQEEDIAAIKSGVEKLQGAETREEQNLLLTELEAAQKRIENEKGKFTGLTEDFLALSGQAKATLKEEFARDPMETLENMKKDFPALNELSSIQLEYVAKSEYIRAEYGKMLKNEPQKFVESVCKRAERLDKVVGKNGTFVEVASCERWTDKPIVQSGALMHPKVADTIIKQGEIQIRGLRMEAAKTGDYFMYAQCQLTAYAKREGGLTAFRTKVGIGDGSQSSLVDHLTQLCGKDSDLVAAFDKAIREKGAKEKIVFNDALEAPGVERTEKVEASTHEAWVDAIQQEKARVEDNTRNDPGKEMADREKDNR